MRLGRGSLTLWRYLMFHFRDDWGNYLRRNWFLQDVKGDSIERLTMMTGYYSLLHGDEVHREYKRKGARQSTFILHSFLFFIHLIMILSNKKEIPLFGWLFLRIKNACPCNYITIFMSKKFVPLALVCCILI